MLKRLFYPTISCRLFDPMPLPRRVSVVIGRSRVPRNRVIMPVDPAGRIFKKIPAYR